MTLQKLYGQFFTDDVIANFMVKLAYFNGASSFLDPAVGEGVFLKYAEKLYPNTPKDAFDIDPNMLSKCQKNGYQVNLICSNYLTTEVSHLYDVIVCNPPYHKFHEIPNRTLLMKQFRKKYNVNLSGYSNLCIYFLIKSINELSKNGKCSYILPYEFLNTGYGIKVKEYLLKTKKLSKIIRFDNKLNLFKNALTTSCILLLENKDNNFVDFINITDLTNLNDYNDRKRILYNDLDCKEKWLKYFSNQNEQSFSNLVPLKEIGTVKRGIATGSNAFFTLSRQEILKKNLSKNSCVPCVCKSPDIQSLILNQSIFEEMDKKNKKLYLFDGEKASTIFDFNYIKEGEKQGFDKGYLTSHRNPWYATEKKQPAPIWISVFSRNKIKIVRNELGIKNLTTFHGIYFRDKFNKEEDINIFFCYLLTPIAQKIISMNKREYGGGLDKFEPNDLNDSYVLNTQILDSRDKKTILEIYNRLQLPEKTDLISKLNNIFSSYVLSSTI